MLRKPRKLYHLVIAALSLWLIPLVAAYHNGLRAAGRTALG